MNVVLTLGGLNVSYYPYWPQRECRTTSASVMVSTRRSLPCLPVPCAFLLPYIQFVMAGPYWLSMLLEAFPSFALFRGLWEMSQYAFLAASNGSPKGVRQNALLCSSRSYIYDIC